MSLVLLGLLISILHSAAKKFVISDVFCQVFYLGCFLISIFLAAMVFNHEGIVLEAIIWCAFKSKIQDQSRFLWAHPISEGAGGKGQNADLKDPSMKGSQISITEAWVVGGLCWSHSVLLIEEGKLQLYLCSSGNKGQALALPWNLTSLQSASLLRGQWFVKRNRNGYVFKEEICPLLLLFL